MSNDPTNIPLATVMRALRMMGLSPVDAKNIKSVIMDSTGITVTRYRPSPTGGHAVVFGIPSLEITTIAIDPNGAYVGTPRSGVGVRYAYEPEFDDPEPGPVVESGQRQLVGPPHAHLDAPCTDDCYEQTDSSIIITQEQSDQIFGLDPAPARPLRPSDDISERWYPHD
jgi:hypothetical protein